MATLSFRTCLAMCSFLDLADHTLSTKPDSNSHNSTMLVTAIRPLYTRSLQESEGSAGRSISTLNKITHNAGNPSRTPANSPVVLDRHKYQDDRSFLRSRC